MKVGTDGALLGAWAGKGSPKKILDIGTGTGLIALMLAQRFTESKIIAIEPNEHAIKDASVNFERSPFAGRLELQQTSLDNFLVEEKFDLIVSNPPFFSKSLVSQDEGRNQARHTFSLSPVELSKSSRMLTKEGRLAVIYPLDSYAVFKEKMYTLDFFEERRLSVKPTPDKPFHRILGEFSRESIQQDTFELTIEKYGRHKYSEEYIELTKDFYLLNEEKPR
ncbi:MAG: methyltransferase [Flavobacteriales bacterium]|nr:methyltransferase [Flavobacteriales bacterium]